MVEIAVAAIAAIASLIGAAIASGDKAKADALRQQAAELYGPEALARIDALSQVGPSEHEKYVADPQSVAAQRLALQRMQEDASTAGLTDIERFDMAEAMDQAGQYERGQRQAIASSAMSRGTGGQGFDLAQQLLASQAGATRAHGAGLQSAANSQRRRALANLQASEAAGGMRSQGFNEFSAKANATDAIAKFNANNLRDNNLRFIEGKANALNGQATSSDRDAQSTREAWAGGGQAVSEGVGAYVDSDRKALETAATRTWEEEMTKKYPGWRRPQ